MAEPQQSVRTSLFFYVPVAIAGMLLVFWVFSSNFQKGEERGKLAPPPPEGTRTAKAQPNERALAKDASLAAKGKTLFDINCATCHGSDGRGDGPRAGSLNPKPRNYHDEKFKFGNDVVSIHNTILRGSPGTSMPSFALLPVEDTWAIAHFVSTLIPNAPPITDQLVAQLSEGNAGGTAGGTQPAAGAAAAATDTLQRVPILFAMERLERAPLMTQPASNEVNASQPGEAIFMNRCASCHGEHGEGKASKVVSVAPYRYANASSLLDMNAAWLNNRNAFAQVVIKGLPGRLMPGTGTLTKQQMDDLYSYVASLSHTTSDLSVTSSKTTTTVKPAAKPVRMAHKRTPAAHKKTN